MTILCKESVGASFDAIKMFNVLAGNLSAKDKEERIDAQLGLVFEEFQEAVTEFEAGNRPGFLKEVADLWVVVVGLLQVVEAAGFDVEAATREVDGNNLTKFPFTIPNTAHLPLDAHRVVLNDQYHRYVIKRVDGKVLKPLGYKAVSMEYMNKLCVNAIPFQR